jgi:Tfp pilus assembly protein PilF
MDIHSKDKKTSEYALKKLANCYRISGEFEKAEETFKKILKKKKKDPLNYLNYGLALKNSAKFAEAKEQLMHYLLPTL